MVIWRVDTGEVVRELAGLQASTDAVAWSPDGSRIAACGNVYRVCMWSVRDGTLQHNIRIREGGYRSIDVCFTRDGKRLLAANTQMMIPFWDVKTGQEIFGLGFVSGACGITMPADQRWIAASARWALRIWDTASPQERVVGEVVRRRFDESPCDWDRINSRVQGDRWLTDEQKVKGLALVEKIRRYADQSLPRPAVPLLQPGPPPGDGVPESDDEPNQATQG